MRISPLFLDNEKWFTEIVDTQGNVTYELTPEAPPEAVKSFEEYYSDPVFTDEEGNSLIPDGWVCDA